MAIGYTTLIADKSTAGSIKNWVNRSDIPSEDILTEAEAWIYQYLRTREMIARNESFTVSANSESVALPDDFLDPIEFLPHEHLSELPMVHEKALRQDRDETGTIQPGEPQRWAIIGSTMFVDALPEANFAGVLLYYGLPAALSSENTTNFLTTRYPTLLRRACIARAYEHMKDFPQMEKYEGMAMQKLDEANATNELYRRAMIYEGAHDG